MSWLPTSPISTASALPGNRAMLWVGSALFLAVAPLALHLPAWLSALSLLIGSGRLLVAQRGWPLPPKWIYLVLSLLGTTAVYLEFGTVLGRDAGVGLLTIMVALKLLETRTQRDCMMLAVLGYFLCITSFLYTQSIPIAVYTLITVWMLTTALIQLNLPVATLQGKSSSRLPVQLAGSLLLQALPFMLIMFMLFPRMNGSLWGLPSDAYGASTGLSDQMTPGAFGGLAQSPAVAFRASFTSRLPEPAERYWRGPVFWSTDGRSWSPGYDSFGASESAGAVQVQAFGSPLTYAVTLEPHQKLWLFALDLPATIPAIGRITRDFQLFSHQPVTRRVRYEMSSYPRYQTAALSPQDRQRALQLPRGVNPQARDLARSWRTTLGDDDQIVAAALSLFRQQAFYYTLEPPQLDIGPRSDPVDAFLFDTRRGFCEHFSAAFTTLMRAAGVPARVVTGYQGGELNPVGGYLIVRQSDAHAWSEVWLRNKGWVRVDPTAAVAPERVERGATLDDLAASDSFFARGGQGLWGNAWLQARYGWDTVNYQWGQWVLGYGPSRQREMLASLGLPDMAFGRIALGFALGVGIALIFFGFFAYFSLFRRAPRDPGVALYQRFCAQLARHGLPRKPSEGPRDFAARAITQFPQHATHIHLISQLYTTLRYARQHSGGELARLRKVVRGFRV